MISNELLGTIVPILKNYGILHASIFGSFARGEQKPDSDLDILFSPPEGMTLFGLGGLHFDLKEALHRDVDLVRYGHIKKNLIGPILKEKVDIL